MICKNLNDLKKEGVHESLEANEGLLPSTLFLPLFESLIEIEEKEVILIYKDREIA